MAQGEAESTDSTSTSLPPLAPYETRRNRIPELFQSLLPLSHRHLSALIHDKLSHLIHDKSSEGPIETSRWRGGGQEGGERTRQGESTPSYCLVFRKVVFITSKGMLGDKTSDRSARYLSPPF